MEFQMLNCTGLIQVGFTLLVLIPIYNGLKNLFNKVTKKPSKATTTRRRLGKSEAFMNILSEERQGSGDICLLLTLRSETKLDKEYVHKALVMLAKRQPMLRAIIITSTNKEKYFEIIDGDKISDMIDFTSSDAKIPEWQDRVWNEVISQQSGTGLLWKVLILQEEFLSEANCYTDTLMFTFKHCCVDGVACIKFCQQFIYYLNGLADGSLTSDKIVSSLSLCPSFVELLTRHRPWTLWQFLATCLGIPRISKFIFKRAVRRVVSRQQCNPFFDQFPPNRRPSASCTTKILFKTFTETETSNIVKACRLNGCTVTGALMAASHLAFCKLIEDGEDGCKDVQLQHDFAINTQRDCQPKPHEEYLGHFAQIQPLYMEYAEDEVDFWQLAQEFTKRIHFELKEGKYAEEIVGFWNCFSTEEVLNEIFSPLDRQHFIRLTACNGVSSLGSFDFRKEQKLHRYRLHNCLIYNLISDAPSSFIHFNTTVNDKMSWVIAYDPSRVVNSAQAQRFANLCFDYFIQIAH